MPSDFRQTTSALRAHHARGLRSIGALVIAGGLLVTAAAWAALARIQIYAVSESARLEACDQVHPVDTLVTGRVEAVALPIGGRVHRGDVLLRIDATDVGLRLDDARATERGLRQQIAALRDEIAAREDAVATTSSLGQASLAEARAARTENEAEATFAAREQVRAERARSAGVMAEADADRANATMVQKQAAATAHEHRLVVLSRETRRELADRRAQNDGLRRLLADVVADHERAEVQVQRLEVEQARYTTRAPIDGVLGQIRAPQIGSMVAVGQTIAVVTPEAAIALRADFAPPTAVGRIQPGQRARMRVSGFPWMQYGVLEATVAAVSSEPIEGRIRVELALDGDAAPHIPRRHGMVGEVEVELEQVSPLALLSRSAGQLLARDEPR